MIERASREKQSRFRRRALVPLFAAAALLAGCAGTDSTLTPKAAAPSTAPAPPTTPESFPPIPINQEWKPIYKEVGQLYEVTTQTELEDHPIVEGKSVRRSLRFKCIGRSAIGVGKGGEVADNILQNVLRRRVVAPIPPYHEDGTPDPNADLRIINPTNGLTYRVYSIIPPDSLTDYEIHTAATRMAGQLRDVNGGKEPTPGELYYGPSICIADEIESL